jgi:hypothetical protein
LPEETLDILKGQRTYGDWTLEVWDNRQGPGSVGGTLISWELLLEYGNPAGRATTLTNGVTFSGVISTNQTNFFVVDVCDSAKVAFITLSGPIDTLSGFVNPQLNLLINREGIPTGDPEKDDFAPIANDLGVDETTGLATIQLTTDPHQPAPLIPGKQLFLAVHNLFPSETNTFDLQVTFDSDTCSGPRPVIRLEDNVAYTNVVAPSRSLIDYYVFNVSPAAVEASFEVTPKNGDVGMVLRYGLPLPDLNSYDYRIDQPGITNELIVLTNTSTPVPLLSGDWYIGVYNNSTNAVVYNVRASEVLDTNLNVITLTNAIPLTFTITEGAGLTNYFLFRVTDPYPGVKFGLYDLNANADLFIGYNQIPSPTAYLSSNAASPTQPVTVQINTNSTVPEVTGNWVLEVVNRDPTNLTFTIVASVLGATNTTPATTNRYINPTITVSGTNLCFSWPTTVGLQYRLEGVKTLSDTNWTVLFGPETATNTVMNYCLGLPTPYSFFQVVELGGSTPPPPTGSVINPALNFGTNGLCLSWASQAGTQYAVQAKMTIVDPAWTNLATVTATGPSSTYCVGTNSPYHYFQIAPLGSGSTGGGTTDISLHSPAVLADGRLQFSWDAVTGTTYQVQFTTNLVPVVHWMVLTNITASSTPLTFTDSTPSTNAPIRFYRVLIP